MQLNLVSSAACVEAAGDHLTLKVDQAISPSDSNPRLIYIYNIYIYIMLFQGGFPLLRP